MEYISYNTGTRALPDIYALAFGRCAPSGVVRIYQAKHSCLCYNYYKQVSLIVHPLILYTYGYVVRRLVIIIIMFCTIRVWYIPYAYGMYHTRMVQFCIPYACGRIIRVWYVPYAYNDVYVQIACHTCLNAYSYSFFIS